MSNLVYLSTDWVAAFAEAVGTASTTDGGTVRFDIPDAPAGPVAYALTVRPDRVTPVPADATPADLDIRLTYAASVSFHKGQLSYEQGYLAGDIQVDGDWARAMDLVTLTETGAFAAALRDLDQRTVYPQRTQLSADQASGAQREAG